MVKHTDSAGTAESLDNRFTGLGVQVELELQQVDLHLAVFYVEPVLQHLPADTHSTLTGQNGRWESMSGSPGNGPGPLGESVPGNQLVPGSLRQKAIVQFLHQLFSQGIRIWICNAEHRLKTQSSQGVLLCTKTTLNFVCSHSMVCVYACGIWKLMLSNGSET